MSSRLTTTGRDDYIAAAAITVCPPRRWNALRRLCLILFLFCTIGLAEYSQALAQSVSVTGIILDAGTNNPLEDVSVILLEDRLDATPIGSITDVFGVFLIADVVSGSYALIARHVGYREYRIELLLSAGERRVVDISMESTTIEFDPIVITASRHVEKVLQAPASITIISARDLIQEGVPSVVASLRTVPGVDIQQAGISRYLVAIRGFNNAFGSNTYTMVDNRESFNPGLGLIAYTRLPINVLDVDRIEVVRGPGSALYGPGVDQGVIHFISKDPFTYPGTSISVGVGQQSMLQGAFRHAGVFKDKLGYKITGSVMEAEDWKLDPDDPNDAEILSKIVPEVRNLNGDLVRVIEGRDYGVYSWNLNGQLQYRFTNQTRLLAYAGYSEFKNILNASLGEIQVDGPGMLTGQLRFQSGSFFAQAVGLTEFADAHNWFYRAGELMYGRSSQVDLQAQYKLTLLDNREAIIVGADYKNTTPRTKGTISGRFEDEDAFDMFGGYVHSVTEVSENINLTVSGRIDYTSATGNTAFSPRAALVYQSSPEHTFRLTYNRALSRLTATDYFGDLQVGRTPAFGIRFLGSSGGFSFPNPGQTSSFVGPGRDAGIGMATARAYGALSAVVAEQLNPDGPEDLTELLLSRTQLIDGFSEGIMTFRTFTGDLLSVAQTLQDLERISEPITQTYEIGYKGVFGKQFLVGIDGYYAKKKDFLFNHVVTPFVEIPSEILSSDLSDAVLAAFTDEDLAPFGITVEDLASVYAQIGAGLGDAPIGLLEPDRNYNPDTPPEMVMAPLNAGTLDYYGADLSIEAFINDRLSGYANYSWVSDNYFDDKAIGLSGSGFEVSMNAPKDKFRAGVVYRFLEGFTVSSSLRYVGGFRVVDGSNYNGMVDSYTLVDAGLKYDFSGSAEGLNFVVTAQNVLDNRHREYIGFPTIGRLVTSRLTYTF